MLGAMLLFLGVQNKLVYWEQKYLKQQDVKPVCNGMQIGENLHIDQVDIYLKMVM